MAKLDEPPFVPKPDPPVRPDGKCAVCLSDRRPERSRKYGGPVAELDPFDRTECCRIYHGVDIGRTRPDEDGPPPSYAGRPGRPPGKQAKYA
jgi:hypothetical protein